MFPKIDPAGTRSWRYLSKLSQMSRPSVLKLLESDSGRVERLSFQQNDLFFDFSKNDLDDSVLSGLFSLSRECRLEAAIKAQLSGEKINETEDRAVLHTELRKLNSQSKYSRSVREALEKIRQFEQRLSSGKWGGYTGKAITDIVNIGIGGSDLGPKMVTHALKPYWGKITPHFISNVDTHQLIEVLEHLNAETTLFIISSKTFTTQETMMNARSARRWFLNNGGSEIDIARHFVAVSANSSETRSFGINPDNMFTFWDWVGGRYSLWSSIGLSIACAVGFKHFEQLLKGAEMMDTHFSSANFEYNVPVIAALIGIWYNNFFGL